MSSLTTSEEIQKQLSIIFGFSGREEIKVGEIVGVGNLTREKVNELVLQVLSYLNEYSALLKDYIGTEIFSMEFELKFFSHIMAAKKYSKGLAGVIAGETAIATVGKKGHGLMYRGKQCFVFRGETFFLHQRDKLFFLPFKAFFIISIHNLLFFMVF